MFIYYTYYKVIFQFKLVEGKIALERNVVQVNYD